MEFSSAIMFTGMIITAVVLKIIFHHLTLLSKLLPESCVLIVVGIIAGVIIHHVIMDDILQIENKADHPFPQFTAQLFFHYLLPPIILDSALALYDQAFFDNFLSIMIFAIFGTLLNTFAIGYSLFGLSEAGVLGSFMVNSTVNPGAVVEKHLTASECLIFSSLISAVDPVAVLAIFEEIHVNIGLYFLVFGESLFNDGVTVVLYNTMITLVQSSSVGISQILMAFLSFFCVVFGGAGIGLVNGLFASLITKFTRHVRVVEPLVIFSSAYFAFLAAEVFHWSGIISIIAYGITVKRYAFQNLSKKSYTTVKYSIKTMASVSDCIIFLFLGLELIQENHFWHPGFIIATIILCLVFRFLSVFLFGFLINLGRMDKVELKELFIMAYGGLRGAVGFSLAVVLPKDGGEWWYRELFVTAALVMVFFTVFLQGGTIKLFVKIFNIELQSKEKEKKIANNIQVKLMEDVMEGVENVVGVQKAKNLVSKVFSSLDKTLKQMLIHEGSQLELQRKFEKICLDEHITNLYAPRIIAKQVSCETKVDSAAKTVSFKDTKKSFRKAVKKSNWQSFKSAAYEDPTYAKKHIIQHLEKRANRSNTLGARALEHLKNKSRESINRRISKQDILVERSKSNISDFGVKLSENTALIKEHYDEMQQGKRHFHSGPTGGFSNNINPTVLVEETETKESRV